MIKKLAKIKYLPNNFQVIEPGDYVECAVSGKKIKLENLAYWNVELQEPYFSYKEAFERNARNLGVPNPFTAVEPFIDNMIDFFSNMPLELDSLPTFPNPFKDIELSSKDTSFLPPSGDPIVGPSSNLATTQNIQQKGQQVFGTNDSVFGG